MKNSSINVSQLTLNSEPTEDNHVTNKAYVDSYI